MKKWSCIHIARSCWVEVTLTWWWFECFLATTIVPRYALYGCLFNVRCPYDVLMTTFWPHNSSCFKTLGGAYELCEVGCNRHKWIEYNYTINNSNANENDWLNGKPTGFGVPILWGVGMYNHWHSHRGIFNCGWICRPLSMLWLLAPKHGQNLPGGKNRRPYDIGGDHGPHFTLPNVF